MNTLKNFNENTKGMSVIYKTKSFMWALKYAWQRAWRGYDDTEVFGLNDAFIERMLPIIKDFRENNVALFYDNEKERIMTETETNRIVDQMLYFLINSDENVWLGSGLDPRYKEDFEKIQEIGKTARSNQQSFLEMFVKYFSQLWY